MNEDSYTEEHTSFFSTVEEHHDIQDLDAYLDAYADRAYRYFFHPDQHQFPAPQPEFNFEVGAEVGTGAGFEYELVPETLDDVTVCLSSEEFGCLVTTYGLTDTETLPFHKNNSCAICQEYIVNQNRVSRTMLRCKHIFHTGCIWDWLVARSVFCPICRMDQRE